MKRRPGQRNRLRSAVGVLGLLATVPPGGSAMAGEVLVAAAANVAGPLQQMSAAFTADTGHTLRVASGASGKFVHQVRAGAPFQVLLAADAETPARLLADGLAVKGSAFTYAIGRLVLWSARPGWVDDAGHVLAGGSFAHLAIAQPKTAPYGAAAIQVLRARGLEASLGPRLVTGESVAQAWQYVHSGQAELGFVALSQITRPGQPPLGSHWLVPAHLHQPIRQDAVLLLPGRDQPAALALLAWLKSTPAQTRLRSWGYESPAGLGLSSAKP